MAQENGTTVIDIEAYAKDGKTVPPGHEYLIRIDKEKKTVTTPTITGRGILALVNKTPEQYKLYQHIKGKQPIEIKADDKVDLTTAGLERFSTLAKDSTEGQ